MARRSARQRTAGETLPEELIMASGEPITSLPNWDPVRKVLVIHRGEREQELLDAYGAREANERDAGKSPDLEALNQLTATVLAQMDQAQEQEGTAPNGRFPKTGERQDGSRAATKTAARHQR